MYCKDVRLYAILSMKSRTVVTMRYMSEPHEAYYIYPRVKLFNKGMDQSAMMLSDMNKILLDAWQTFPFSSYHGISPSFAKRARQLWHYPGLRRPHQQPTRLSMRMAPIPQRIHNRQAHISIPYTAGLFTRFWSYISHPSSLRSGFFRSSPQRQRR